MSYQVLARKWRPQKFQDVIGQAHITRSLQNAIIRKELGHAYILTGTRGIGKTSVARLFAKSVRCEQLTEDANPCHKCSSCEDFDSGSSMNVVEIDGASNNSVDNVRDLIGNVQYSPTSGQYKVYIIDEVHMLSNQAFNALLKTLEEPPAHVIFIMATTEPQKLLGTVLSRCQRFDFRNASVTDLTTLLKEIAAKEEIQFESDRLIKQICREGKGSVRDTLSLLDQVLTYSENKKIDDETLSLSLGLANAEAVKELLDCIFTEKPKQISQTIDKLITQNISIQKLAYALLDQLYEVIKHVDSAPTLSEQGLIKPESLEGVSSSELFWVYETMAKDFSWILDSLDPHRVLDICLQKLALRRKFYSPDIQATQKKNLKEDTELKNEEPAPNKAEVQGPIVKSSVEKNWPGFVAYIKKLSPASATNLEQGNLTSDISLDEAFVSIHLGFNADQQLFYDYFQETEVLNKLKENISTYFEIPLSGVNFQLELIKQEGEEEKFMSIADIKAHEEEQALKRKKSDFVSSPIIQEAEKLFKSKIDKIVFEKK